MASTAQKFATKTPPSSQSNCIDSSAHPTDDIVRIIKRQRESDPASPRTQPNLSPISKSSPSKISRLSLADASRRPVPLTGAAALEDERRRRHESRANSPPPTSPNPSHKALTSLMSGSTQAMSRPSDVPQVAPTAAMEPAARAASTLSIAAGNAVRVAHHHEGSPPPASSPPALASVTESPTAMEVDPTKNDQSQDQQLISPEEKSQPSSLSYPGSLQTAINLAEPHARGMSFPIQGHAQSSPTLPAGKKHKCPYCSTEFTRHHNLKSHLLTHSQEKPYVCTECQMRFRRLHDLKRHGKLHTGEKPHICPKCDRKFARGDALARHSKGAGGCAGRRASMGSFADGEDLDGSMAEGEDSSMSGVAYDNPDDEELRRQSLPSIGSQQPSGDNYNAHSRTYPPAGPRSSAGGLYQATVNTGQIATTGSSSVPDSMASSHTASTSISSAPGGTGGTVMYSQAGMTESPKPLSPGLPAHEAAHAPRQRSPSSSQQYQQPLVARRPSDLQSPHSGSQRPKLPGLSHPSFPTPNSSSYNHTRTSSGAQAPGDSGNMFAQSDPSVWEYIRLLEDKIKSLSDKVVSLDDEVVTLKKRVDIRDGGSAT